MKIGAEKKGELIALIVLVAVAVVMLWHAFFSGSDTGAPPPAPAAAVANVTASTTPASASKSALPTNLARLDPRLHLDKLDALRARDYAGDGRDLFRLGPAPPPPPTAAQLRAQKQQQADAVKRAAEPLPPPPPPPPPPIPLKFYGFVQANGFPERIFLQFGDDNFVVSEGETVAHRYLIETIGKLSVRVKDLVTKSEQELPLQQSPQSQGQSQGH